MANRYGVGSVGAELGSSSSWRMSSLSGSSEFVKEIASRLLEEAERVSLSGCVGSELVGFSRGEKDVILIFKNHEFGITYKVQFNSDIITVSRHD